MEGATTEFFNHRYNNCANRAYYACFQAAVHALAHEGLQPTGRQSTWGHDTLQATFNRELITRRKVYSSELRAVLTRNYKLRELADYRRNRVSAEEASRALRRGQDFVSAVQARTGGTPI